MINMRFYFLLFFLIISQISFAAESPPIPMFHQNECEGESCGHGSAEGIGKFYSASKNMPVFSKALSRKIVMTIPVGEKFKWLAHYLVTTKASFFRLTKSDLENQKCDGPYGNYHLEVKPGEKVYLLFSDGEGSYKSWHAGKFFFCDFHEDKERIIGNYKAKRWDKIEYNGTEYWWTPEAGCNDRWPTKEGCLDWRAMP